MFNVKDEEKKALQNDPEAIRAQILEQKARWLKER